MASSANDSVVTDCGCTVQCGQPASSVGAQDLLREARLGLMMASVDARVVALQARQSYIGASQFLRNTAREEPEPTNESDYLERDQNERR
ncbi:hypothetical protein A9K55_002912 [Cordyceps militaris]|uniref:Uncharacterized protein n=1 Tax=Cordyceps militaris TaxID=73501 RepID=A0A2H4S567_CORMI|nr:hypothetical protein A9K55_002912 [Cordyceps militaris]